MVREASVLALRERRAAVTQDDMLKALNTVMVIHRKNRRRKNPFLQGQCQMG